MSSSHREISQTGQAYPEGSSHGWSTSLEVKKKKTQDKRTGNSGDKGFLSKPGGCLHTSTQEKPGREKTKKQRTRENSKTVTGLMDQHSSREECWSIFHHARLLLCRSGTATSSSELIKHLAVDVRQAGGVGARAMATGSNRRARSKRIRGRPNVLSGGMRSTVHRLEVSLALS